MTFGFYIMFPMFVGVNKFYIVSHSSRGVIYVDMQKKCRTRCRFTVVICEQFVEFDKNSIERSKFALIAKNMTKFSLFFFSSTHKSQ